MNDLLDILRAMAGKKGDVDNALELFLDMAQRVVKYTSGEFGTKPDGGHNDGINVAVPAGTSVKAAENGVVLAVPH